MHEKPNTIGVGDIRTQVNDDIMIRPYSSKYKIYIIADADMMSVEAQNALLKTIEEPPEYAVIMLLTENAETLLPTIRSRCVMMKLRNIKDQLVKKYLMEQLEVPDYKADVCVAFAQGNMGKAIMLANSEYFNEIKEEVVHLLRNIDEMTVPDLMEAVKRCMIYKMEISDYLDMIAIWYRDVLIYKATRSVDRLTGIRNCALWLQRHKADCISFRVCIVCFRPNSSCSPLLGHHEKSTDIMKEK